MNKKIFDPTDRVDEVIADLSDLKKILYNNGFKIKSIDGIKHTPIKFDWDIDISLTVARSKDSIVNVEPSLFEDAEIFLLEDIIEAISDLKYCIDIQKPENLYHPGKVGVKQTEGYNKASQLLPKLMSYFTKSTKKLNKMLVVAIPIGNIVTENSKGTASNSFDKREEA